MDYRDATRELNLNRPRLARLLIELAVGLGWTPAASRGEFIVSNGFHLLREHAEDVEAALGHSSQTE